LERLSAEEGTPAPRRRGIDTADYVIAATVELLEAELLTTNVRHFPTIEGLVPPY
jgi:predicted nucleic acid-binding protein